MLKSVFPAVGFTGIFPPLSGKGTFSRDRRIVEMRCAVWVLLAVLTTPVLAAADDQVQIPWGNKFFVQKDPPPVVVHDFGTVPWGTTLTHRFVLTNIYAVPMQIVKDPEVSCGCVRIVKYTAKLEPREAGFVDVEMDGRRFQGAKAVTIQVRFGPKFQSTALLQVRAFGRMDVQVNPGQANFGVVALGQAPVQNIDVTYSGQQQNWQITQVSAANAPSVTATVQRLQPVKGSTSIIYRVAVSLKPDAEAKPFQEQIVLTTNDAANPVLAIPVAGTVQSPLSVVQGASVRLDPVAVNQETVRIIIVRGNKPFRIAKVEGEGEGLTVSYQQFPSPIQNVTVTFKPTQAGELKRKLTITTDQNESTSVIVEGTADEKVP